MGDGPLWLLFVDFLRFLLGLADVTILKAPERLADTLSFSLIRWLYSSPVSNMVGQKRVMGNRGKISARFFATLQLAGFLPAIWGQNHRLVQVEESEDEVCRALSCDKRKR